MNFIQKLMQLERYYNAGYYTKEEYEYRRKLIINSVAKKSGKVKVV